MPRNRQHIVCRGRRSRAETLAFWTEIRVRDFAFALAAPIDARAERPESIPKMRRLLACAFTGAVLSFFSAPAAAANVSWTFCVASARGGDDVWITDVFAAARGREKLERDMKAYLALQGATRVDAQCPAPVADKTAAINAQFAAIEFNRKLGAVLHEVAAREFELRR